MTLASRICNAADPGAILVSDVVRELGVAHGFSFVEAEQRELKGFSDPVPVFELLGRTADTPTPERQPPAAGSRGSLLERVRGLLRTRSA